MADHAGRNGRPGPRRRPEKPSKAEAQKEQSEHLRGQLAETLGDADATKFADADLNVIKHHGIYQQYDRDTRATKGQGKADRSYTCMVRCRIPGGVMTAEQYLVLDGLARRLGHGSVRLTTRQAVQFHGIVLGDLKALISEINETLLSTLAACGDVMRNVMCCPAIDAHPARRTVQRQAEEIAFALAPRTAAYHEIWLDGEKLETPSPPPSPDDEFAVEPLYGKLYLPRKFKLGIALPDDNCVDVYTQDCGLIAIVDDTTQDVTGYNVVVGGGLGMTHRKADTFARLASLVGSITPEQAIETVATSIAVFRDHGDREDRRHARLKYVIEERGTDWFIEEFNDRASFTLQPPVPQPPLQAQDHLGWTDQGDGTWSYGLFVENGRLRDDASKKLDAVRTVVDELRPGVRITAQQNLLLTDVAPEQRDRLIEILRAHGVPVTEDVSLLRRNSMACPALPTCGLALADAERNLPDIITSIDGLLDELGLSGAEIGIRMTGCPNGCARPYTADIAFVGRSPGVYDIYAGGRLAGDRLVDVMAEKVGQDDILDTLRPALEAFRDDRRDGESFGDFWQRRSGRTENKQILTGAKDLYDPTRSGEPIG